MIFYNNVNVIPMTREVILKDQVVGVDGNLITHISASFPQGCTIDKVIDCKGGYLIPGLCDMHVHLEAVLDNGDYFGGVSTKKSKPGIDWNQYMKVYLACGITQVRNMSGVPELLRIKKKIESREFEGPHIYCLSPIIDGKTPLWGTSVEARTDEEAAMAVWNAKNTGYDGIKIYNNLTCSQFDAILSAAKQLGMSVSGHVPIQVKLNHCLESNFLGYEHVKAIPKGYVDIAASMHKTMTATLVMQKSAENYSDKNHCELMFALGKDRHLSPEVIISWKELSDRLSHHDFRLDRKYEEYRADACRFFSNGGILMAGSDAMFPFSIPGYSLHEELCEFVIGGLTPFHALETATRIPAEFMGIGNRRGTIEVGKEADMTLLKSNPFVDIRNTSDIIGVAFQGYWYGSNELSRLLEEVDTETAKYYNQ